MAVELATAYVSLTVSAKGIKADLDRELGKPAEEAANKAGAGASKSFSDSFSNVGGSLTKVGAASVAAAGLVGGALFKAAGSFTDLALSAGKMADTTGLAVGDASRWTEVAADMGIEAGTLESTLNKMNLTAGKTPEKFAEFGVEIARTKSGAVDANQTFLNTVDRLNAIEDPAKKAEAATALLGKGWTGMSELIAAGSDSLTLSLDAVSKSKVIDPEELQKAKEFRAAMDTLKDAGEDLALSIGQSVAPMIGSLASGIGGAVQSVSDFDVASGGMVGTLLGVGTAVLGAAGSVSFIAGQTIKMKDRFTDTTGALNNFGKAAAGLGAALGIAGIAFGIYQAVQASAEEQQRKVAERAVEIADALKLETDALLTLRDAAKGTTGELDAETAAHDALNKALIAGDGDGAKLARTLGELGFQSGSAADSVIKMKTDSDSFIKTLIAGQPALQNISKEVGFAIRAEDDWSQVQTALNNTTSKVTDEQWFLIHAIENLQDVTENTDFTQMVDQFFAGEVASSAGKEAMIEHAKAAVEVGGAVDDSLEAYQNYLGLLAGLTPAQRAALESTEGLTVATDASAAATSRAGEAARNGAEASTRAGEAARDGAVYVDTAAASARSLAAGSALAESDLRNLEAAWASLSDQLDADQAMVNLERQVDDVATAATAAFDAQVAANEALATGADDAVAKQAAAEAAQRTYQDELANTKQKVLDIGEQIGLTPTEVETLLTMVDNGEIAKMETRITNLARKREISITPIVASSGFHLVMTMAEHGGPAKAGQPMIVGEKRPEVFVPDVDGYIMPSVPTTNTALLALQPNSSGANGPRLNIEHLEVSNDLDADGFFRMANFHMAGV